MEMNKGKLILAYEAKDGKPKPSDKTEMINEIHAYLVKQEQENEAWLAVEVKAPTRQTVINWLTGETVPTETLYKVALSEATGIAVNELFT